MGKSVRAKSKVRFRNIRRDTIYASVEQARLERLSEKLGAKKKEDEMEVTEETNHSGDAGAEADKTQKLTDDVPAPKNKKKKLSTFQRRKLAKRKKLLSL